MREGESKREEERGRGEWRGVEEERKGGRERMREER